MRKLAMIAAGLALVAGAASAQIGGWGAPLGEKDAGHLIPVGFGTKVQINLPGNAGTGYSWQLTSATNAKLVAPIAAAPDPATPPGMVGGPVSWAVKLRFLGRGKAGVTLAYVPPGRGRKPDKVLTYRFVVR